MTFARSHALVQSLHVFKPIKFHFNCIGHANQKATKHDLNRLSITMWLIFYGCRYFTLFRKYWFRGLFEIIVKDAQNHLELLLEGGNFVATLMGKLMLTSCFLWLIQSFHSRDISLIKTLSNLSPSEPEYDTVIRYSYHPTPTAPTPPTPNILRILLPVCHMGKVH